MTAPKTPETRMYECTRFAYNKQQQTFSQSARNLGFDLSGFPTAIILIGQTKKQVLYRFYTEHYLNQSLYYVPDESTKHTVPEAAYTRLVIDRN
jgi:predicted proteasome-type protease